MPAAGKAKGSGVDSLGGIVENAGALCAHVHVEPKSWSQLCALKSDGDLERRVARERERAAP